MGSPSPSLTSTTMHSFVFLSVFSLALAAPMPEGEESPAALPYVHDATGDVAEAYVHEDIPAVEEDIAAEPYVHDTTGDVAEAAEDAVVPYVHEEIAAEVYEHEAPVVPAVAPVTCSVSPTAGVIPIT